MKHNSVVNKIQRLVAHSFKRKNPLGWLELESNSSLTNDLKLEKKMDYRNITATQGTGTYTYIRENSNRKQNKYM